MEKKPTRIEYMCSYCGKRESKGIAFGRPMPGKCPRKANGGPHSWRINRKFWKRRNMTKKSEL